MQAGAAIVAQGRQRSGAAPTWWSKSKSRSPQEYVFLRPGLILFTYLHLAPLPELTDRMLETKVNGVAYETIHDADGSLPLLTPMSEVAGRMAVQIGAQYLEAPQRRARRAAGRRARASRRLTCVIIGGGVVGTNAAKIALGMGAHVTIIDRNLNRLRATGRHFQRPDRDAGLQRLHYQRNAEARGPGGGRGADSRGFGAQSWCGAR